MAQNELNESDKNSEAIDGCQQRPCSASDSRGDYPYTKECPPPNPWNEAIYWDEREKMWYRDNIEFYGYRSDVTKSLWDTGLFDSATGRFNHENMPSTPQL